MRIVKSCKEMETTKITTIALEDIPNGTVFRYGSHLAGPYLKTASGIINLESYVHQTFSRDSIFGNYKPLDKAVLVLNED